ncbi:isoform 3 of Rap1 GTPase-GDP dissociation stimulator 1 [Aspergillus udagawae]|uniref:Isoform 3 of Rap1 GTPase-GDP dissociation stimulator 1 n=1 Tax=Aspergillus udagawae TaxID=91492 RepID=A0ABQ1BEI9_9EURO|nr:isoform 3 of Rap1 GTPase-GDP dissociation stimulator 1 [Aspergillus udagawae]GFF61754.1 isoform 3 of Rap1 GTPase-GDP dissociation stimulator 1 [Aspergillus udagawae]GFG00022.1 isoform 3 of Rap1 GTPase-GDP dissociation stimulator 1 [Aspergillus udagawae]GFG15065.1 isoform 3 of Rap1 GTPase-GDP dissociation stimulator 1 [Aspergillus udagawae]
MIADSKLDVVQTAGPDVEGQIAKETSSRAENNIDCPSLGQILSKLSPGPSILPVQTISSVPVDEQAALLRRLEDALAEATGGAESFEEAQTILMELWKCGSSYLALAADALANGSRNASWRLPYGRAGILNFFLQIIASREFDDNDVLLHALRLVGNSCADTDENRALVVKDNYTAAILNRLSPDLVHVMIPVIYNICIDYEPAQSQLAANKLVYILLRLIKDGMLADNEALLDFSYELIELLAEQEQGSRESPGGTILLLLDLLSEEGVALSRFVCLANCLMTFLDKQRFQDICVSQCMVERVLSVLKQSLYIKADPSSSGDAQALAQLQLKINQTLSEVSASPKFPEVYPLESPLVQTLKDWLASTEDQLQICSCVMLGNLARSDAVCEAMVRKMNIQTMLISILRSDARGAVLHSALGILKNLAIAGNNRQCLGDAGIIPAVSRLWGYETVPQVQFAATSIVRQVIISSIANISRLLELAPTGENSSTSRQTYLSSLLSLCEKSDSTPIKTEVGRIVASICRTIVPKSREADSEASTLLERLFTMHEGVALPVGAMIAQSQWPVVRSEGWFALALMASTKHGTAAVTHCLQKLGLYLLLEETMTTPASDSADEADKLKSAKDCDNIVVLIQELLKNDTNALSASQRATLERLMHSHVSQHLQGTRLN